MKNISLMNKIKNQSTIVNEKNIIDTEGIKIGTDTKVIKVGIETKVIKINGKKISINY
jgi:hypothetical protein